MLRFPTQAKTFVQPLLLAVMLGGQVFAPTVRADEPVKPAGDASDPQADKLWSERVEPILKKHCFSCHGGEKQKGGLDVRSLQAMLVGGTDGSVVIPGRPQESPLLQRIVSEEDDRMPPEKDRHLSADEIHTLTQWVSSLSASGTTSGGAKDWEYNVPSLMELAAKTKWSPPATMTPPQAIDHLIATGWERGNVVGNERCDDTTFVRRVYLDLAGRIPTVAEAAKFLADTKSDKRAALVDQLLAGQDYPRHLAEVLDIVLLDRKEPETAQRRRSNGWLAYLQRSVAANRPWNQIVKDVIVARPKDETQGAQWFLYEQKNNHQLMAEAIAPVAFGVTIDCAQCHNHPLAPEIKQQNYWGLVTGFNRTTNADTQAGPALSESAIGGFVNFTNLKKESQPAVISLLNGKVIEEARPGDGAKEEDSADKYLVPPDGNTKRPKVAAVPKFSRREAVAEAIASDNPLLARAFVNRIWAMLLGRGLVHPVNEMDSRHPPSHPELLAWLADDFAASNYDIKRLIRNITQSRTYQLAAHTGEQPPPAPELFACALEKPLSAEVLYQALLTATGNGANGNEGLRAGLVKAFPAMFAVEYNVTLQQSAFLTNSPLVDQLLKPQAGNLTERLLALVNPEEQVQATFQAIVGRAPDTEELAQAVEYLRQRTDRPEVAVRHLQWALLASPEFLLNH